MFELVSADLCLETVELLTRAHAKTLLDEISARTGIKWIEVGETVTISGGFKQVELSRTYLHQAVNQSGRTAALSGLVEDDINIDPTLVSRSVYVTGFQPTATWENLMTHFNRVRNGGGDIDSIVVSREREAAVITFYSLEGKLCMVNLCAQLIFQIFRRLRRRVGTLRS